MKYLVTPAPHKYSKLSVNDMYMYTAFALAVCFLYGVINYGYQAFFVLLPCLGTCVVLELIINSIQEKRFILKDFSCLVSGLVLTCIMPINMPWYLGLWQEQSQLLPNICLAELETISSTLQHLVDL